MAKKYLDGAGLSTVWSKIKDLASTKADKIHNQESETILLTNYTGVESGDISVSDNVNTAISKLDNKIPTKYVETINNKSGKINIKTINSQSILGTGNLTINTDIPVANSSTIGGIKSGTDITVDGSGNVTVVSGSNHNHNSENISMLNYTKSVSGAIEDYDTLNDVVSKLENKIETVESIIPESYTLPTATSSILGGVKSGGDITVNTSGLMNLNTTKLQQKAVTSINNYKGDVIIATINGKEIVGNSNITIDTGIQEAPTDNKTYVRKNGGWWEETIVDTSNFATKDEIPSVDDLATKTEISDMLTKTEAGSTYATKSDLSSKQDKLVSRSNIKTINGQSVLGSGNISIDTSYDLPVASSYTLGGVKEGGDIDIDYNGIMTFNSNQLLNKVVTSVNGQIGNVSLNIPDEYVLPIASYYTLGGVKGDGDIKVESDGNMSISYSAKLKTINGKSIVGSGNIAAGIEDAPIDSKKYVRRNANWVEETSVDTSNFATKDEIPSVDGLATKAEISDMLTKTEAGSTYAAKADLDTKVSTETYEADKATFALKSEIPSVDDLATKAEISDMLTKTEAGSTYAAKADLNSKQDELISGSNIKTINGQSVLGSGNISIDTSYDLPVASTITLGGVKGGGDIYIDSSGIMTISSSANLKTINGTSIIGSSNIKTVGKFDSGTSEIFNDYSNNTASGVYSHTSGYRCSSSGDYSFTSGINCNNQGNNTFCQGSFCNIINDYSNAIGYSLNSYMDYQLICGKYNATKSMIPIGQEDLFVVGAGSSSARKNAFTVQADGNVFGKKFNASSADYAEMFEWEDGNPNNEDRVGYFVTLNGNKIKYANSNSYILGIVSATPSVLGNNPNDWKDMYLKDEWGRTIYEDVEVEDPDTKEIKVEHQPKVNPDYDPNRQYEMRSYRKEWAPVGMLGQLLVRQDGTLKQGSYCKPNENGIATASDSGYYVIEIKNDRQALVLIK